MTSDYSWLRSQNASGHSAKSLFELAKELESNGQFRLAATAYDLAFGRDPGATMISDAREKLLEQLSIVEYDITFRYIPAGTFQMGSDLSEADEQPIHEVELDDYWISETPVSWATFCDLMNWEPPPLGFPKKPADDSNSEQEGRSLFPLREENKIRLQYCESGTVRARDWHAHSPNDRWITGSGAPTTSQELFGEPNRNDPRRPWSYDRKPMVSVSWQSAEQLCKQLSSADVLYRLPTEAEWEKAARGALVNCMYPWGNELPSARCCDFDRFDEFSILPARKFKPNGYGLYAMSGGVWEWTADWYEDGYYKNSPALNPFGPQKGEEKVLRGGSWSDCAEVVTVSYRMSRHSQYWGEGGWGGHFAPNIGFRICRKELKSDQANNIG